MVVCGKMVKIKVDIDHKRKDFIDRILAVKEIIESNTNVKFKNFQVFETNRGFHVICDVYGIERPEEIIILQLLFGSDWKREAFNYVRLKLLDDKSKFEKWNVLFDYKFERDEEKPLERFLDFKKISEEKIRKDLEEVLNNG